MNVIICEDERIYQKSISEKVRHWMHMTQHSDVQIMLFSSSEDLLEQWKSLAADILFLDIQFGSEMNGVELAKEIRKENQQVPIVFVTSMDYYVYEGYTVSALRYLRKPIRYEEIAECLDIAYKQYSASCSNYFIYTENGCRRLIPYQDILYFEARSPYSILHLHGQEELRLRIRFSELKTMLVPEIFVQCHRSYLVNIAHVRGIKRSEVFMSNKAVLPISRPYLTKMNQTFDRFYLEG